MIFRSKLPPVASCVPKDKPPPTKRTGFLLLLALILSVAGAGISCSPAPNYQVESYQALQEELKDIPDAIFADITKYQNNPDMVYEVFGYGGGCSEKVIEGYDVYYSTRPYYIDWENHSSVFSAFHIKSYNKSLNVAVDEYEPNMTYRGIQMQERNMDETEIYNASTHPELYPRGTYVYYTSYHFDLLGYRYSLNGTFALTPEELQTHDSEQVRQAAKDELFALIDSILDQGGIPK